MQKLENENNRFIQRMNKMKEGIRIISNQCSYLKQAPLRYEYHPKVFKNWLFFYDSKITYCVIIINTQWYSYLSGAILLYGAILFSFENAWIYLDLLCINIETCGVTQWWMGGLCVVCFLSPHPFTFANLEWQLLANSLTLNKQCYTYLQAYCGY